MNLALALQTRLAQMAKEAGLTTIPAKQIYFGASSPDGGLEDSETTVKLPCLIFTVEQSEQRTHTSTSRKCPVKVIIRTQRDDEKANMHGVRCDEVHSWLNSHEFLAHLGSSIGFTVTLVIPHGSFETQAQRHLETSFDFTMSISPGFVV